MKHLIKTLICITAILALLLSSVCAFNTATGEPSSNITQAERAYLERLGETQKHAADAHDVLYNSFLIAGSDIENYPNNFGGDYIDGNTLHILVVDLPTQDTTYYTELLQDYLDYIVFENADYPLRSIYNSAHRIARSLIDDGVPVTSYGADIKKNCISIGIDENDLLNSRFCNSLQPNSLAEDTIPISYHSEPYAPIATTLIDGSALRGCTLGVCGTYQGSDAIGLSGHGFSVGHPIRNFSGKETIGVVKIQQWSSGENGDYSIAQITNPNYTTAGLVGDPNSSEGQWYVTGASNRPAVGTSIIKYGMNGGFAYGTVENNNCTWTNNNREFNGMVKVRLSHGEVKAGDSGGPNFSSYGVIFGTTSTQSTAPDNGHYFFSPYLYLNNNGFVVKTYE